MSEKFKMSGIGIDTSRMTYNPEINQFYEYYNYIHTSIDCNNDFLISDFVKEQSGAPLITTVSFIKDITQLVLGHLLELGRDKIDLLLIDSECSDWDSDEIVDLIKNGIVDKVGVSNPDTLVRLKDIIDQVNDRYSIDFVSMNICPLHFKYDIIKWLKENHKYIIGFNPFGGKLSCNNIISSFTVPYLLGFAATYCDVVFLSGQDMYYSNLEADYLKDLIGKDTEPKYTLKKSVSKLQKPLKKVISESLVIGDDLIFPIDSPEMVYNTSELQFSLKDPVIKVENNHKGTEKIDEFLNLKSYISDLPTPQAKFSAYRYEILGFLSLEYLESEGWEIENKKLGDLLMVTVVRREVKKGNWINKKTEIEYNTFIIGMINDEFYLFKV